jgi:carbonic anhydrase
MNAKPQNRLFLVCPFCQMERFITKYFGDALFLTAPASVFYFDDDNFLKAVKKTIQSEKITDIYLVGEVSCRIVQYVLQNESITGLRCESEIQELLSSTDTPFSLTEKLLKKQLYEMTCHSVFGKEIEEGQIRLHALLTSRHDDFIAPINCEFLQRMTMPISNINPLDNTNYRHLLPYAESIF